MRTFTGWKMTALCVGLTAMVIGCGDTTTDGQGGAAADATIELGNGDVTVDDDSGGADTAATDTTTDRDTTAAAPHRVADTGGADTFDPACPGGSGCPCKENADCDNAVCLWEPGGKRCATPCTDSCQPGFACKNVASGADAFFACVSTRLSLCAPCKKDSDCAVNGVTAACLDYGDEGKFCGATCDSDSDCPSDYACEAVGASKSCKKKATTSAGSGKACTDDQGCEAGEVCDGGTCAKSEAPTCACTPWAIAQGASTTCSKGNDLGTCPGERVCEQAGLSACDAPDAVEEVCNTKDDDCNGITDDLQDRDLLQEGLQQRGQQDRLQRGLRLRGGRENVTRAVKLIGECFGTPSCTASGTEICNGADTPTEEQCDLKGNDFDGQTDEDYVWSPDGTTATLIPVGGACGVGACAGGAVVCQGLNKAVCDSDSKKSKEVCDNVDNDCNGVVDDPNVACDDNNECTKNICDGAKKACDFSQATQCDDGNQCTTDACDKATGKCTAAATIGAACDDSDACTVGDSCVDKAGTPTCAPGKTPKNCDDGNLCTDDSCDKTKGCVAKPNAATKACYTGPKGTDGVGTCKTGLQTCVNGTLDAACKGEVVPVNKELCDGKDDNCDKVVDDGCGVKSGHFSFATASVTGKAGKTTVMVRVGGDSQAGSMSGAKNKLELGFLAWFKSLMK